MIYIKQFMSVEQRVINEFYDFEEYVNAEGFELENLAEDHIWEFIADWYNDSMDTWDIYYSLEDAYNRRIVDSLEEWGVHVNKKFHELTEEEKQKAHNLIAGLEGVYPVKYSDHYEYIERRFLNDIQLHEANKRNAFAISWWNDDMQEMSDNTIAKIIEENELVFDDKGKITGALVGGEFKSIYIDNPMGGYDLCDHWYTAEEFAKHIEHFEFHR